MPTTWPKVTLWADYTEEEKDKAREKLLYERLGRRRPQFRSWVGRNAYDAMYHCAFEDERGCAHVPSYDEAEHL